MTPTTTTLTLYGVPLVVSYDAERFDAEMSVYPTSVAVEGSEEHDIKPLLANLVVGEIHEHCLSDAKRRRAEGLAHAREGEAVERYEDRRYA